MKEKQNFFSRRRPYAPLAGAALALLCVLLWRSAPSALSFLYDGSPVFCALAAVLVLFALLCAAALIAKLCTRKGYRGCFLFCPAAVRLTSVLYLLVWLALALSLFDRVVLGLVCVVREAASAGTNPQGFLASMIYMLIKGKSMFLLGIWTTVRIALFGTAIAFVLALLMVVLRILKPARQDTELAAFLKRLGSLFARFYITVIRGTPMMVQSLIIYYAGFGLLKHSSLSVTEINQLWSAFTAGLITVSLNSTAYLAEVLRGGIESIDAGQLEAAHSLGMTTWQAMLKVIFPQAVRNSIPAIGNEFIINIKDSSVLSVIACFDLMFATTSVVGIYYRQLEVYCIAAIFYLILTCLSSLLMNAIAKKLDTPSKGIPSSN